MLHGLLHFSLVFIFHACNLHVHLILYVINLLLKVSFKLNFNMLHVVFETFQFIYKLIIPPFTFPSSLFYLLSIFSATINNWTLGFGFILNGIDGNVLRLGYWVKFRFGIIINHLTFVVYFDQLRNITIFCISRLMRWWI